MTIKIRPILIFYFINLLVFTSKAQNQDSISFLFYNVENLFDTEDDPLKNDNEFLPSSKKKWNNKKWHRKTHKISQVIAYAGLPDIIGLCEVENKVVLEKIVNAKLLRKKAYKIIHFESPDTRGIDVALLYNPSKFDVLSMKPIPVPLELPSKTRDILAVTLKNEKDTITVFVNHWPSRRGGKAKSAPKRQIAANTLNKAIDSTAINFPSQTIVAMGDFNDEFTDPSLKSLNKMKRDSISFQGTLKYKKRWQRFDMILFSEGIEFKTKVIQPSFLFTKDKKNGGTKPFRTYQGPRYIGGFSDHLPVKSTYQP